MGGITKTLFGGSDAQQQSEQRSSQRTTFDVKRTPYSFLSDGLLTLDPTIRSLQEETLSGFRSFLPKLNSGVNDFLGDIRSTRASLAGNAGALREARLSPLREAIARRRGELTQSTGQRGLAGSSFAEQSLSNFELDAARQIGEASALADADTLSAQTGIDKDILNAIIGKIQIEANLLGLPASVAQQRLQEELAAFGLGKGSEGSSFGTSSGSSDTETGIFTSIGGLFSGLGSAKKAGVY